MKLWLAIALVLTATLVALAAHLYWKDALGVRTKAARLFPANYERQDLTGKAFNGAWLPHANFRGANLREAEFSDAHLRFADFSGADFTMAGVSDADFTNAVFDGATLKIARGHETAIYRNASFRNTDLTRVGFHGMSGRHNRSKPRHMMDPGAGGADMSGAVFDGAKCHQTLFSRCNLAGASFKGSDCREADFSHADLRNADFTNADLRGAKMDNANTAGTIFTNARLK
jgi:uncharacterized protein YjbI with pentapeptide repeats